MDKEKRYEEAIKTWTIAAVRQAKDTKLGSFAFFERRSCRKGSLTPIRVTPRLVPEDLAGQRFCRRLAGSHFDPAYRDPSMDS